MFSGSLLKRQQREKFAVAPGKLCQERPFLRAVQFLPSPCLCWRRERKNISSNKITDLRIFTRRIRQSVVSGVLKS
jgi:hypothetical protein